MADVQKLNVNSTTYDISTTWSKVTGKPSTFTPSSHTHSYLPLSGGTMSNSAGILWPYNIHSWDAPVGGLECITTYDGTFGYYSGLSYKGYYGLQIRAYGGNTDNIQVRGYNHSDWGTWRNIIHSGNIGDQSVNYATSAGSVTWSGVTEKPTIFTANGGTDYIDCNNIRTNGSYYVSPTSANKPGDYGEMLCMSNVDTHAQIYVPYSNGAMKFRGANNANGYYSWRTVIDDNNYTSYCAAASHSHNYLPLTGGTLTGLLNITTNGITANYGAQNSSWVHFTNSAGINYYFSNSVHVNGDIKVYNKSWGVTNDGRFDGSGFYQSSDERLKTFYDPIKVDLEKLKTLRKNYFKFNDKDKLEIGVSAQEIQEIYPEIVSTDDNGYLSVAYDKLSVIALSAIDELDNKYRKENNDLREHIEVLEGQLEAIKNILNEKGIL